jgi:hypothetical protein
MKSYISFSSLAFFTLSILLFSCSEETVTEDYDLDFGYDYYPLEVGKYLIYKTDSTTFNIGGDGVEVLESSTFVKEEIIGITLDNEGDTTYIIERFKRLSMDEQWQITDVWTTKVTDLRIERTEENVKLIKMIFPLQEGIDFDATLFVDPTTSFTVAGENLEIYKDWNSEVLTVGTTETIGGNNYNEVATISYANDENLIEKRYALSQYAKGIGLVYREDWILDTQCGGDLAGCEAIIWEEKAEKGYIIKQVLLEYN